MKDVLLRVETPVCVGSYARWGSGKSFMIQLLQCNFDKYANVKQPTKELVQWFEYGSTDQSINQWLVH